MAVLAVHVLVGGCGGGENESASESESESAGLSTSSSETEETVPVSTATTAKGQPTTTRRTTTTAAPRRSSPRSPITVTDATFANEVEGAGDPVLVFFWAEWCGPCRKMTPDLDDLGADQPGGLKVAKLNVDDNLEVTQRFDVENIPTLILYKGGEPVERLAGARDRAALDEALSQHL